MRSTPSRCRQSKKNGLSGQSGGHLARIHLGPEPAHRHLERVGPPILPQGDHLAIQHNGLDLERLQGLNHLGETVGDVGQVAGEDPDVVAAPVRLNAGPVDLPLDGRRRERLQRRGDALRRLRQHGEQGPQHLQTEFLQGCTTPGQGAVRDHPQIGTEQHGPAHQGGWDARRPGYRLNHDALRGALPEVAEDEPNEELLLGLRYLSEQLVEQAAPLGLRAWSGGRTDHRQKPIGGKDRQLTLRNRWGQFPERRVPDADRSLAEHTGQEADPSFDLIVVELAEQTGQQFDLGKALGGCGDLF